MRRNLLDVHHMWLVAGALSPPCHAVAIIQDICTALYNTQIRSQLGCAAWKLLTLGSLRSTYVS